jgi:hypothetical protein
MRRESPGVSLIRRRDESDVVVGNKIPFVFGAFSSALQIVVIQLQIFVSLLTIDKFGDADSNIRASGLYGYRSTDDRS